MLQPERFANTEDYRYAFQGQEKYPELYGEGNSYSFKYRIHDARIGRFLLIDPLTAKYPWNSPYAFSENEVIAFVELEGLEKEISDAQVETWQYLVDTKGVEAAERWDRDHQKGWRKGSKISLLTALVVVDILLTKGSFTVRLVKEISKQAVVNYSANLFFSYIKTHDIKRALISSVDETIHNIDIADAAFSTFIKSDEVSTLLSSALDITIDEDGNINGESIMDNKTVVNFGIDLIANTILDQAKGIAPKNMRLKQVVDNFIDVTGIDIRKSFDDFITKKNNETQENN